MTYPIYSSQKNSCNFDDKIDEREDGIDLGESDEQNKNTGGTPRDRKVKDLPPFSILNVVESSSSSNKFSSSPLYLYSLLS